MSGKLIKRFSDACNECSLNAICSNNVGSYTCECFEGYEGRDFALLWLLKSQYSRKKSRDQEMVLIAVIPMNVKILICVHNTRRARTAIFRMSAFVMKDMKVMEMNVMM